MAGCVYVMVIPEWRNIVKGSKIKIALAKIGHVDSPENLAARKRNLEDQYRGAEFRVECVMALPGNDRASDKENYLAVENSLHRQFASQKVHRINNGQGGWAREFFDLDIGKAMAALRKASKDIRGAHEVKRQAIMGSGHLPRPPVADPQIRKRSDIPKYERLTYVRDQRITCKVEIPGKQPKVRYKNEKTSRTLTELTKKLTGYESVAGPGFWYCRGVLVSKLRYA